MHRNVVRALIGAVLHVLLVTAASAGVNSWTIKGPSGGFFRDIEASPTNSNVFYAAYGRAVFRSTDGGASWQVSRDFVGEAVDIAVDPTDGNRLYVAVLNDGLFRSEDGGQTFSAIALSNSQIWSVGVGGADGKTVYYATGSGAFFRSTDRGANWTTRTSTFPTLTNLLIEGTNGESILAIHGTNLVRSTDSGGTWSDVSYSGSSISAYALVRVAANTLAVATNSGIFISSNDGASWTVALGGSYNSLAVDSASPGTIYAGNYGTQALVRSTNSGTNWASFGSAVPSGVSKLLVAGSRFLTASQQGVQLSTNSAVTWVEAAPGPIGSSATLATTLAANSKIYAFTADGTGGLFASSNDSSWQRLRLPSSSLGQTSMAVKPGDPQTIYLAAFSGVFRSIDGGSNWSTIGTGISGVFKTAMAIDPANPSIMYAAASAGSLTPTAYLYRSTDSGVSWSPYSVDLPAVYGLQLVIDPANSARMYLAGYQGFGPSGRGGFYRSIDGGLHWSQTAFAGLDVRRIAIDPSDSNRIYAVTATGLQVSTDGGTSFVQNIPFSTITNQYGAAIAIDPVVPMTLYAASYDPGNSSSVPQAGSYVLRSVDRGQTWETLRAPNDGARWYAGDLVLDPGTPSLIYLNTSVRGVATYEIVNDLAVSILGHSGIRATGVASTFTLKADNLSALAATNTRIAATLPAGLTNVSASVSGGSCNLSAVNLLCMVPVLRGAQSVSIVVSYTPPSTMAIPVSATVTAHERDVETTNNTAQATAATGEVVDLRVTVTPSGSMVNRGDNVTYTVQISNGGPIAASAATLTFTAASGLSLGTAPTDCTGSALQLTCNVGGLAVGTSRSFTVSATASETGTLIASASVAAASTAVDADASNNSTTTTINVQAPSTGGGSGGGGGGSFALQLINLLMLLAMLRNSKGVRASLH